MAVIRRGPDSQHSVVEVPLVSLPIAAVGPFPNPLPHFPRPVMLTVLLVQLTRSLFSGAMHEVLIEFYIPIAVVGL